MTKKIENVAIIGYNDYDRSYAVQWEYNGALYHIWEFHDAIRKNTIYKNPPLAPGSRYFKTVKLKGTAACNVWMIAEVTRQVKERDLVGQIERDRRQALFAEIAVKQQNQMLHDRAIETFTQLERQLDGARLLPNFTITADQVTALLHFYHNHKPAKATDND